MRRYSLPASMIAMIAACTLVYAGCAKGVVVSDEPTVAAVASVAVTPGSPTLIVNTSTQLTATTRDAKGVVLTDRPISWESNAAGVASVTASGMVRGVAPGQATIMAHSEGQTGTASVTVQVPPVATVAVTPSSPTIGVYATVQLTAILRDANGADLSGRAVTWETSAGGTASVNGSGVVTGVAAGQATITARSEGKSGSATVTVQAAPVATVAITPSSPAIGVNRTVQLTAILRDANGADLSGRAVTWETSAGGTASISASGLVTGIAAGQATITARSEGRSGSTTVTVQPLPPPPVASITVAPTPSTIIVNGTVQLSATTRDASGAVLTGRAITWETAAAGVATVSASGLVRGVAAGQVTITARSEGQAGTATVTVQVPPVASVTVAPASPSIAIGATVQLTATPRDASGAVLSGRTITWATSAAGTATVNGSGVVTGVASGQATITATSEGQSGNTVVTIQAAGPAPVATIAVTPSPASVAIAGTLQLTATLRDAGGNVLSGRTITWETSAAGTASVNGSGVVTGVAAGQATITARSEGQAGSTVVTVPPAPAPVATIAVTPSPSTVAIGATVQLTATLRDAGGAVLTGRAVTWETSAAGVATVSATGLVRGVAAGSATITARSEGQAGTAAITVPNAPPPPPPGAVADPTLLPLATRQTPPAGTYGRGLTSGQTYIDPVSGLTVLKITDASTPIANTRAHHDYSEAGPYISQPWQGTDGLTYYTLMVAVEPNRYLVDLRYDTMGLSNWRVIDIDGDLSFAFSLNPATPRIAYAELNSASNIVQRYNTATNRVENTGNWPWRPGAGSINWFQNQVNDQWFVAMGNNTAILAFRPSDGLQRSWSGIANLDEPHIDRELPYVYIASGNQNLVGNLETGGGLITAAGDPAWSYHPATLENSAHVNPVRGHLVGIANSANQKFWTYNVLTNTTYSFNTAIAVVGFPGEYHQAGQWVFNNGDGNAAQWFATDPSGNDFSTSAIRSGMIGITKTDGSPSRIVAVHNSTGGQGSYESQPHVTLAPDGKFIMWTSDSRGSGRTDAYIVRMPVR